MFYLHGSMILKGSGLTNSSKIIKNQDSNDQLKKNSDFEASFSLILGLLGTPFGICEHSFLLKKGVGRQPPARLEEIMIVFGYLLCVFDRPGPF